MVRVSRLWLEEPTAMELAFADRAHASFALQVQPLHRVGRCVEPVHIAEIAAAKRVVYGALKAIATPTSRRVSQLPTSTAK